MTELLTAAQMRAIEQAAIASGKVTGLELMERAGRGVVDAVLTEWPGLAATSHKAVILCGPGNNGGDGFVVARLLKERGWEVEVFLYGDPEKLPPDAWVNYERWCAIGEFFVYPSEASYDELFASETPHLIIDAFFGTGLTRVPPSEVIDFIQAVREMKVANSTFPVPRCVSIDMPTGVCSNSGRPLYSAFCADLTVTFHRAKLGHFLSAGPFFVGKLHIVDIGLEIEEEARLERYAGAVRTTCANVGILSRHGGRGFQTNKYTYGHALILSGGSGQGGAARLAARGALRIGAGLVTVGCPPEALTENAARLDAIMLKTVEDTAMLHMLLQDDRINALCLGPGLGLTDREANLVSEALQSGRNVVLDADALSLLAQDAVLFGKLHEKCVLTPHNGEFARLFPDIHEKLKAAAAQGPAYSKVDATRDAAARAGCIVLFKGADTVIAEPSGWVSVNAALYERAAPWLATAGSGDVLAGMIAGLLARGLSPMTASETAAWLHTECALSFGPGLIAEDLPQELPKVLRTIL